eukprot:CAMPEP_0171248226 /NCGR_PEP_ID=MMETSP0790-20130122/48907_1 /TAXON_ID=2925 /ORGANISM="Alexandrium catenella, Strain OF101" /LENGTH=154 /DNA_ID=CAMNT_0011715671 /DNA_START=75 /DNA_END=537 /DNA_ORIENTATION=-
MTINDQKTKHLIGKRAHLMTSGQTDLTLARGKGVELASAGGRGKLEVLTAVPGDVEEQEALGRNEAHDPLAVAVVERLVLQHSLDERLAPPELPEQLARLPRAAPHDALVEQHRRQAAIEERPAPAALGPPHAVGQPVAEQTVPEHRPLFPRPG